VTGSDKVQVNDIWNDSCFCKN